MQARSLVLTAWRGMPDRTESDQVSSHASQTPPGVDASALDFCLLADGFMATTAPRKRRMARPTARPTRKAMPSAGRSAAVIPRLIRWTGHNKCPQTERCVPDGHGRLDPCKPGRSGLGRPSPPGPRRKVMPSLIPRRKKNGCTAFGSPCDIPFRAVGGTNGITAFTLMLYWLPDWIHDRRCSSQPDLRRAMADRADFSRRKEPVSPMHPLRGPLDVVFLQGHHKNRTISRYFRAIAGNGLHLLRTLPFTAAGVNYSRTWTLPSNRPTDLNSPSGEVRGATPTR